jgi:hypothetical protein
VGVLTRFLREYRDPDIDWVPVSTTCYS